jgi:hypothetical protein
VTIDEVCKGYKQIKIGKQLYIHQCTKQGIECEYRTKPFTIITYDGGKEQQTQIYRCKQ